MYVVHKMGKDQNLSMLLLLQLYRACAITNDPVIHYPSIDGFINVSRLILIYYPVV